MSQQLALRVISMSSTIRPLSEQQRTHAECRLVVHDHSGHGAVGIPTECIAEPLDYTPLKMSDRFHEIKYRGRKPAAERPS
jgi:hypothetical protein